MTDNIIQMPPTSKPKIPEFITRSDIDAMSDDELDAMIAAIRVRRMKSYAVYKQTKDEKAKVELEKVRVKIDKKCEQIIKDINSCDKSLDKLEQHIAELRGLRLQADMELI